MKGILLAEAGGQFTPVDNLEVPKPSRKQILVKSLVTSINPVFVSIAFFPSLLIYANSRQNSLTAQYDITNTAPAKNSCAPAFWSSHGR